MTEHTCDKCGHPLDADTLFCPHCGAAVFRRNPSTSRPTSSTQSAKPDAPEGSPAEPKQKTNSRGLVPIAAVVLALILALALNWHSLEGFFSPGEDPQLSTNPSAEQTSPSQTYAYDPDAKPTKSTAPSTEPTTEPTTMPTETEPPETVPLPTLDGTPLSADQLQEYSEKLISNGSVSYHNLATTTVFSHPKEINLYFLFCNGIDGAPRKLSDKEFAHFVSTSETIQYLDVRVLPPDMMDQVLTEHFGITFNETEKQGMDQFAYWEETGNYYWFGTDANGNWDIEVIAGSTLPDGSVQILYRSTQAGHGDEVKNESNLWIMTFTPEGKIFSNLPA